MANERPPIRALLDALNPSEDAFHSKWIIQISSEMFTVWQKHFLPKIDPSNAAKIRKLSSDFAVLELNQPTSARQLFSTVFPRWASPLAHQWPVDPNSKGFVEKATQGLMKKFGHDWRSLELFSTSPKLKTRVTGLRGRMMQLKAELSTPSDTTSESLGSTLSVVIDDKGLFAGLSSSRLHLGTCLVGGLGFLSSKTGTDTTSSPSRAGGKIDEVLQLLQELNVDHHVIPKWLELGAAPGGMTQRLIDWGANVTAVDLAEIKKDITNHARVNHLKINAQDVPTAESFDALLSDMNGPFINSAKIVARLGSTMKTGRLIVYVLKLNNSPNPLEAIDQVKSIFLSHGIEVIQIRHLFHNRQEVTLICQKT